VLFDFAFHQRNVRIIVGGALEDNISSQFNFRRLGFTLVGKYPRMYRSGDRYVAALFWMLEREAWINTMKAKKSNGNHG